MCVEAARTASLWKPTFMSPLRLLSWDSLTHSDVKARSLSVPWCVNPANGGLILFTWLDNSPFVWCDVCVLISEIHCFIEQVVSDSAVEVTETSNAMTVSVFVTVLKPSNGIVQCFSKVHSNMAVVKWQLEFVSFSKTLNIRSSSWFLICPLLAYLAYREKMNWRCLQIHSIWSISLVSV